MGKTIVISRGNKTTLPKQNLYHNPNDPVRFGTWCKVLKRYSIDHTVDVETAEGFRVTRVPVTSKAWVTLDDPILGERNLPPEGAIVFMFMPTGGIDNAFIFNGCFLPFYDKHVDEFLVEGKEDEEFTKTEGNWQRKFDKVTGDLEIVGTDDDKTLTITVKKSEKRIQIKDWNDNDIVIDENGTKLTDTKGNMAVTDDNGMKVEDKNGNKATLDSAGIKVEDKTGNNLTMTSSGVKLEAKSLLELVGMLIKAAGTAVPNGQGGWCAIPTCPYAGIPHIGDTLSGG